MRELAGFLDQSFRNRPIIKALRNTDYLAKVDVASSSLVTRSLSLWQGSAARSFPVKFSPVSRVKGDFKGYSYGAVGPLWGEDPTTGLLHAA